MEQTYAEIITIGDEILYGQTLDTNSHWMSQELDKIGIKLIRKTTIPDIEKDILNAFKEAEDRADIILITGGLGPTNDDLTKPMLCKYFNTHLEFNEDAYQDLVKLFSKVNREITERNKMQAELPANCEKITNSMGTAPGMWFFERGKVFISMPGVPYEMKQMMTETILPRLQQKFIKSILVHKVIMTIGIAESDLAEKISEWEENLPSSIKLAYLPSLGSVKLRLTGMGTQKDEITKMLDTEIEKVKPLIESKIYSFEDEGIEAHIGKLLKASKATIACAESCTGGYLAHLLTSIPGSSAYFKGGVIAYANEIKQAILEIDANDLEKNGAVSEEVVKQMASNVREKLMTDIGIAISGVAGPGGGTKEKPVGMVWLGYADRHKVVAKKYYFSKDRKINIQFGARKALDMIRLNFSPK